MKGILRIIMNDKQKGIAYILISALLFSIGGLFIKLTPWSAMSISGGRCIFSSIIIGLYMLKIKHKLIINKQVILGAFFMFGTVTFFIMANKMTTAANAIILQYTAPIFIMLFTWIIFKKKPRKLDVLTGIAVFSGVLFFFIESIDTGGGFGNLIAIFSGICYAGICMLNSFPEGDALSSIFLGHTMAAITGLPFIFMETIFTFNAVGSVVILGIFQVGIAYLFFYKGMKTTPPVAVSLISGIEPVLNPIWVAVFYGETIGHMAFLGASIVLVSIVLYNMINARETAKEARPVQGEV